VISRARIAFSGYPLWPSGFTGPPNLHSASICLPFLYIWEEILRSRAACEKIGSMLWILVVAGSRGNGEKSSCRLLRHPHVRIPPSEPQSGTVKLGSAQGGKPSGRYLRSGRGLIRSRRDNASLNRGRGLTGIREKVSVVFVFVVEFLGDSQSCAPFGRFWAGLNTVLAMAHCVQRSKKARRRTTRTVHTDLKQQLQLAVPYRNGSPADPIQGLRRWRWPQRCLGPWP